MANPAGKQLSIPTVSKDRRHRE